MPAREGFNRQEQQPEDAGDKFAALCWSIFHQHAEIRRKMKTQLRPKNQNIGRQEQRHARDDIAAEHPNRALRAAELNEQQRDGQQLEERVESPPALDQRDIGPQNPGNAEQQEQDRQAASRGREFAAKLGQAERGEQHNQPNDDQYAGGRGRPWQRYREYHGKTIGQSHEVFAIERHKCQRSALLIEKR